MQYAINCSREGYKQVGYKDNINFNKDTLYFEDIRVAYRYLYYANGNKFEILVKKSLLSKLNLLRVIIAHGCKVSFIKNGSSIKHNMLYTYLNLITKYKYNKQPLVDFCPTLTKIEMNKEVMYILDGYVVNFNYWDYKGDYVNAIKNREMLPFSNTINDSEVVVENVSEKILWGANRELNDYSIYKNKIKKTRFQPKVYIYSVEKNAGKLTVSIFFQGYEYYKNEFVIECSEAYETEANDDWKYYSKDAYRFKNNFTKLTIDSSCFELNFKYDEQVAKIMLARHLQSDTSYNDVYVKNYRTHILIDDEIQKYKSDEYKKYEKIISQSGVEMYLFSDRRDRADDNAEALYKYYMENTDKNIWFAVSKESLCWNRLMEQGFKLVDFGSEKHKQLYLNANKIISSHAARRIYDPFFPNREFVNLEKHKLIFLQHGIIMGNHHGFLDKVNNPLDLMIASTSAEADIISSFSGYKNVQTAGLARYDNYFTNSSPKEKYIIYAPSWNVLYKEDLAHSKYVKEIEKVLNSRKINDALKQSDIDLKVILHPEFIKEKIEFENVFNYKILQQNEFIYSDILKNTLGLITDYSSLLFDVLYQERVVIEHQPYKLHHENNILSGYQKALYATFNIEDLEQIIKEISASSFKLDESKIEILDTFFDFKDNNNCKRNFMEIEKI